MTQDTQVNLGFANQNRFFSTQKRWVYVDNFMGTVHTEGQGRQFGGTHLILDCFRDGDSQILYCKCFMLVLANR